MQPLVSIVIPVYNGANYLKQAIDSALSQTYKNIEVIVVNDGSNDGGATERVALSYGDKIRYFAKENGGVSSALNRGISEMRGEYFSWLSHDDMYTPSKIASHISMMNKENKECIFVCGSSFIDENSLPLNRKCKVMKSGYYTNSEMLSAIFHGYLPGGCCLLIPKVHFDRFGKFNEELRYMQDAEMWYRFLLGGVNFVCHRDDICVQSRVHGNQVTVTGKHLYKKDLEKVGPMMVDKLSQVQCNRSGLLKEYMYMCCKENNANAAKQAYCALKNRNQLGVFEKGRYMLMLQYGKIRPLLVRCYYALFFKIKVVK